jgi:Histidine kinase-, DNA gyrase B-, and HSP90-like ATPase
VITEAGPDLVEEERPLELRFGGSLVEQLGAQLYPSATATVAELISNAWDADAEQVWVDMPFEDWGEDAVIEVVDDGHGMNRDQVRDYLLVGRKRRLADHGKSEKGRDVHGRKGLGKLAAFGTAGLLECTTKRQDGELICFQMDYDAIRGENPDKPYPVTEVSPDPLVDPKTGDELAHGTRIRLSKLRQKRRLGKDQFFLSMSRRFAVDADEMVVKINDDALGRFSYPVQFRFPPDAVPDGLTVEDGWIVDSVDGKPVKWWMGFSEKPLDEEGVQGISVLARGKMAQRPFKFERVQGTTGQLGQEYLVGEVEADWLDVGDDIEDDLIQSNRDQLQLEDQRLEKLLDWGQKRLRWALNKRNELRRNKSIKDYEASEEIKKLLEGFTPNERKRFLVIAHTASGLPEIEDSDVVQLMQEVVNAREDQVVRELMDRIETEDDAFQGRMWGLVAEFGLIDARRTYSIIEARLRTIEQLERALAEGAREVPDIHEIIIKNSWLLDPRWDSLGHEVDIDKLGIRYEGLKDEDTGRYIDFLFALAPQPPAKVDQIVVVELKRGTHPDGRVRKASLDEVNKFHFYVQSAVKEQAKDSDPPRVRGLMIANDYSEDARMIRATLEDSQDPVMEFKRWGTVLEETQRLHLSWLNVTKERLKTGVQDVDDAQAAEVASAGTASS